MAATAPAGKRAARRAAAAKVADRGTAIRPTAGLDLGDPARPLRMAIYIRISTDEDHQPFSLEAQHTRLLACIGTQPGWKFTGLVFRDEKSGATTDRKDLQRALSAARAGWFDILLVYRVDRLSRSMRGLVEILDQLDAARVGFSLGHRARGHLQRARPDAGADARRLRPVRARDDHRPGDQRHGAQAARGEWPGGYRPYGYELDHTTGRLVIVDAEAAAPPLIFDLYVRERLGARGVANVLNERGHRTKAGKRWSTDAVLTVLRNRVYLGEIYFRGTWYRAENHQAALVDADLFAQAQQILIARGDDHSKRASTNSEYTLAG